MQIRAAPDSNVRAAGWRVRRKPGATPLRGLARSLLCRQVFLAVLLASASSMSCIIPVGPEFQDPPQGPDIPPYIHDVTPASIGSVYTVLDPTGQGKQFTAFVLEATVGDFVYYRWVFDYPPYTSGTTVFGNDGMISPRTDGQPIDQQLLQQVNCGRVISIGSSSPNHQLDLIVANRPFLPMDSPGLTAEDNLDSIDDPTRTGSVVRATWIVNMVCPVTP
jgi:hypothetical protein